MKECWPRSPPNIRGIGVSPVIGVILMVAVTMVLAGVVFLWASSFSNESTGSPEYFNVKASLTTTEGSHPVQRLTVEVFENEIRWSDFTVRIDDIILNASTDSDRAGGSESFDVPNGDFPSGGIDLTVGSIYTVKIISIDNNRIAYNDDITCSRA